jgi:thymidylate synthase (FAD)
MSSNLPAVLMEQCGAIYNRMVHEEGICPEQARMVLPQSMYTEWYWTGNLYSFANVFIQRTDSHAQREVQDVARQIGEIIEPLFPVSWEALTRGTGSNYP